MDKKLEEKSYIYALKNAVSYDGSAKMGAVISSLFHEKFDRKEIKENIKKIEKIVKKVNSLSEEEQKKEFEKLKEKISFRKEREGLPKLPNAEKGVVMRIAPSASGPMHIFHGINASLNFDYVRKYGGKFYVRIEDTNPANIDPEAYRRITEDAKWLTKNKAKIEIQSDRMKIYYRYAKRLIKKGKAYVCTCPSEKFRNLVRNKKPCPCRKNSIEKNLERWKRMLENKKKNYLPGEAVLRFKSNIKHPNPAMRDFPLARISEINHPRQKKKYRVWPLMNLAVSVDDIEMKMTHVIRGKDHRDNAERQKIVFDALGKKYPWVKFLGRYHFKNMPVSTSLFRKQIEEGKYSGWDDPNLPTLISLKNQGYFPEAFWKMAEHIGISEVDKILDKEDFFSLLRKFNNHDE